MARRCPRCGTSFPDAVAFCGNDGTITLEEQDPGDLDPRIGSTLGGYIVTARVADGAMGRVYEARNAETRERVAIKVLHDDVAKDQVSVERFKREADTARGFSHPNIVKVVDFGRTPDRSWFMTMEFLQGEELSKLLRRIGPLPPERVVRIVTELALGLEHAHSFGVIHRDLKPDNIFCCDTPEGDFVKILDFGSVKLQMEMGPKLTAYGTTLGSPYYMSPEQAMGRHDVDVRTDVFALGGILYEMLTSKIAFDAKNVAATLMRILNDHPTPPNQINPSVPASVADVVERAIRKDKEQRFATPTELADALCRAYGLAGTVEELARTPAAALARALASATATPAQVSAAPSGALGSRSAEPQEEQPPPQEEQPPPQAAPHPSQPHPSPTEPSPTEPSPTQPSPTQPQAQPRPRAVALEPTEPMPLVRPAKRTNRSVVPIVVVVGLLALIVIVGGAVAYLFLGS